MIFVVLGTHERPFYRLVKEIDNLALKGKIKERIVVQLGFTDYKFKAKNIEAYEYIPSDEFEKIMKKARIVITHGGAGTIMLAIRMKKPVIAVPRMAEFGEHADNHQLQIVKEMSKHGNVIAVEDVKNLMEAIKKAEKLKLKDIHVERPILKIIEEKLKEWGRETL